MAAGEPQRTGKLTAAERAWINANARQILERELGLRFGKENRRGWSDTHCPVPNHQDDTPSFGVNRDGACRCQGCGLKGNARDVIAAVTGCSPDEATRRALGNEPFASRRRPGPPPRPDSKTKNNGALVSPVPDDAPPLAKQRNEVARYPYRDKDGRLLFYVVRTETTRDGNRQKDCIPWTLRRRPNGKTGWKPTLQGILRRPIYGTETLTDTSEPVICVEGENVVEAVRALWGNEFAVVTTLGGFGQVTTDHALEVLKDRTVIFWPDHDENGDAYARALAIRALNAGAKRVAIVNVPPELPAKWDLADLSTPPEHPKHAAGFTAEKARALIDAALVAERISVEDLGATHDSDGNPWGEVKDFAGDDSATLPEMDLALLPPVIGDTAKAIAKAPRADPAMAAVSLLAGIGAAVAKKCAIRIAEGYNPTYSNIAAMIADEVAGGKSTAISVPASATTAAIKEVRKQQAPDVRRYLVRKEVLEGQKRAVLAEAKSTASENTFEKLETIERDLEDLRPCLRVDYVADDITPESLAEKMEQNDGRAFVCSAEPAYLANLSGRYDATKESSAFLKIEGTLKALTNEHLHVDRKGKAAIDIELPALTVLVGMHPETLAGLRASGEMVRRGLFSRHLFVCAKDFAPSRRAPEDPGNTAAARVGDRSHTSEYDALIGTLTCLPVAAGLPLIPPLVKISRPAYDLWRNYYDEIHKRAGEDGDLQPIRGWALRSPELLLRVALNLHVAKHPTDFLEQPMAEATMNNAATLMVDYFRPHAWHAHYGGAGTAKIEDAEYLARRCHSLAMDWGRRNFSLTELTTAAERFRKTAGSIDAALSVLVERGIVNKLTVARGVSNRPAQRYELNPRYRPREK